jgi:peptidoglycan/LPS O-acetylase OafA/YrhL
LGGIEGLRAIACLLVLVTHVWEFNPTYPDLSSAGPWLMPNTGSGLTLFFVLSGFLLYRPFATAVMRGTESPSTGAYLRNRALRIIPAYVVIFVIVALVLGAAVTSPAFFTQIDFRLIGAMHSPALLLQNLLLVQGFTPNAVLTGIGTAWTLGVEVVFYLALPLLAFAAMRLARGRTNRGRTFAALAPAAFLLALGIASKVVAAQTAHGAASQWGPTWHAVFERSFPVSADLFAFGMAAAAIVIAADMRTLRIRPSYAGFGALVTAIAFVTLHSKAHLDDGAFTTAMALCFGLLVLYVTLPRDPARPGLTRPLETRVMVYVGVISYSVYLWHEPLVFFLRKHGLLATGKLSAVSNVALVLAVTVVASSLTYRFIEAPALRRKARMTRQPAPRRAQDAELAAIESAP